MHNCINLIKISILKNKKGFIISNTDKNLKIIKAFMKLNIIKFAVIKNNNITVFINYVNNKPTYNNIINLFKPGGKRYISLKTLKKINNKYNWLFIISTNKGVITSIEALNQNVGGLLLAKIWN